MDADDDEFITTNNDGYGLEDDDILARWEEMLPPGISDFCVQQCISCCVNVLDLISFSCGVIVGCWTGICVAENLIPSHSTTT